MEPSILGGIHIRQRSFTVVAFFLPFSAFCLALVVAFFLDTRGFGSGMMTLASRKGDTAYMERVVVDVNRLDLVQEAS